MRWLAATSLLLLLAPGCSRGPDADGDGWTVADGDCDEENPDVHPEAEERCDGVDNDCDGVLPTDEIDGDDDGYMACEECDDADTLTFPGADELCDGVDNDCDGALPAEELDGDGDGALSCEDCDDAEAQVFPGAEELCNGRDDDCDGSVPADETTDGDADGFLACEDCDDADALTFPEAPERCDREDTDCDGLIPEDETQDVDGDGFVECEDCDDHDDTTFPGAEEVCGDGVVNDCGGDESGAILTCIDAMADLSDADAKLVGEVDLDWAGGSVSGAGDVNADGYDDFLVGAFHESTGGYEAGATYLVLGSGSLKGSIDLATADAKLIGEADGDGAGFLVSGAGDVNADGYDDLLVGAYLESTGGEEAGAVYLVLGSGSLAGGIDLSSADAKLIGEAEGDRAGSTAGAGDVNADGYDDLLVGAGGEDTADEDAGAVYLILGSGSLAGSIDLSTADAKLTGVAGDDHAGVVSSAGDVNADGYADLLVGAPHLLEHGTDHRVGRTYLVLGSESLSGSVSLSAADTRLIGEADGDGVGVAVSGAGDVNADGYDDLLMGAFQDDTGGSDAGAAYLVLGSGSPAGSIHLSTADAKLVGEASGDRAGFSVAGPGDIDADGFDDLLVGAFAENTGGYSAGATYLVLGSESLAGSLDLSTAEAKLMGESDSSQSGYSVSGAGDVDADGYPDLLIGACTESTGGFWAGATYLVLAGRF